jgi:hypothetical protein
MLRPAAGGSWVSGFPTMKPSPAFLAAVVALALTMLGALAPAMATESSCTEAVDEGARADRSPGWLADQVKLRPLDDPCVAARDESGHLSVLAGTHGSLLPSPRNGNTRPGACV